MTSQCPRQIYCFPINGSWQKHEMQPETHSWWSARNWKIMMIEIQSVAHVNHWGWKHNYWLFSFKSAIMVVFWYTRFILVVKFHKASQKFWTSKIVNNVHYIYWIDRSRELVVVKSISEVRLGLVHPNCDKRPRLLKLYIFVIHQDEIWLSRFHLARKTWLTHHHLPQQKPAIT